LRDKVKSFKLTLNLYILRISKGDLSNFPTLQSCCSQLSDAQKGQFTALLKDLSDKFEQYFPSFDYLSTKFQLFTSPFTCDPFSTDYDGSFAEELIKLQCDSSLENEHKILLIYEFWVAVCETKRFPLVTNLAATVLCMFGTTYVCEALFSEMKHVKSKTRSRLSDSNLTLVLRIMNANKLKVNFSELVRKKRCQVSKQALVE